MTTEESTIKGTIIGLKDLHYAILTQDDETGGTYEDPVKISDVIEVVINPTTVRDSSLGRCTYRRHSPSATST